MNKVISYADLYRTVARLSEAERSISRATDPDVVAQRMRSLEHRAEDKKRAQVPVAAPSISTVVQSLSR
ncbi:hypothetical protein [Cupriavidus lacunae]|uniref:hypothetical protein n=1 Tax=Cupriavidus lacunae TaxID=2666307 RepID=UPI0010589631|nr:hypothetical protein [Cupriavidus lacunae]